MCEDGKSERDRLLAHIAKELDVPVGLIVAPGLYEYGLKRNFEKSEQIKADVKAFQAKLKEMTGINFVPVRRVV